MATKTKAKTKKTTRQTGRKTRKAAVAETVVVPATSVQPNPLTRWGSSRNVRYAMFALAALLLLGLYWYRTNSWPIVALVNNKPIFRSELNKALYAQAGQEILDNMIMERLIADEMKSKNVVVADADIQAKIDEIKASLGSEDSFQQALQLQGMTEESLKAQFKLQMGLEKLVEPSTDSAEFQQRIYDYLQTLRNSNKVKLLTFGQK